MAISFMPAKYITIKSIDVGLIPRKLTSGVNIPKRTKVSSRINNPPCIKFVSEAEACSILALR